MIWWIKEQLNAVARTWNWFWFDSRSDAQLVPMALFRVCFCGVLLFFYFTRAFDVEFFYSASGILPAWYAKQLDAFRYHPTLFTDSTPLWALHSFHSLFLLTLFLQMIGLFTRPAAVAGYLLHMLFINRNMTVIFGVDMIGTFFLLYLCFATSNSRFSLDSYRGKGAAHQTMLGHIAWRLMQVQLCVVYGFSGLEKCKGSHWWNGLAAWDVLTMGNMQRWDLSFVAHVPLLLSASVYVILFWEIYFPVLVWVPKMRLPMLVFGVLMHLGIFVFLNLPSFGFMMISFYILFLKEEEVARALAAFRRKNLIPSRN